MSYRVDELVNTMAEVRVGEWRIARPVNARYESFWWRLRDAWLVLTRKADAVTFDERTDG